jgi:hypothetical protein
MHEELALRNGGDIAWAFRKNSPELAQIVNNFVKENRKGSLMGNILFKRYLQNTQHVRNVLDSGEMEKFNATAAFFQQFADQYDFDWLMLIALMKGPDTFKSRDSRKCIHSAGLSQQPMPLFT